MDAFSSHNIIVYSNRSLSEKQINELDFFRKFSFIEFDSNRKANGINGLILIFENLIEEKEIDNSYKKEENLQNAEILLSKIFH